MGLAIIISTSLTLTLTLPYTNPNRSPLPITAEYTVLMAGICLLICMAPVVREIVRDPPENGAGEDIEGGLLRTLTLTLPLILSLTLTLTLILILILILYC